MPENTPPSDLAETSENKTPERDSMGRLLPGHTANPNGRPKGTFSLVGMLKAKLQEVPEGDDKRSYAQRLIDNMVDAAVKDGGDLKAIVDIVDRVDGKPVQQVITAETDVNNILDGLHNEYNTDELISA